MRISSWWQFDRGLLSRHVDGILEQVRHWRVAVIYGATSPKDRLYMARKSVEDWSVHESSAASML